MNPFLAYLFRVRSQRQLQRLARRLRLFRFVRAFGGHANDGDDLQLHFSYESEDELRSFFHYIGFSLVTYANCPPQPVLGKSYSYDVFSAFPSLIPGTKWIQQPGFCQISGEEVYIWCTQGRVQLSISKGYVVTEQNVKAAEKLEPFLSGAPLPVYDPPLDDPHCICPKYYPDWFR